MQRVQRVLNWVSPMMGALLIGAFGFGYRWIESRASRVDVADKVAATSAPIEAAVSASHHAASLADAHTVELRAVWLHVIAMRAELEVLRQYGRADPATRGRYIELAQKFYAHEYELQLTKTISPAEAARLALLAEWRPPR